jgi:hypothetical protein
LDRRPGEPQTCSGHNGEEKISQPLHYTFVNKFETIGNITLYDNREGE